MIKYKLKSGKRLDIDIAPLEKGLCLYRTLLQACMNVGLDLSVAEEDTVRDLFLKNIEAILSVLSSEAMLEAIKECCDKVVYDNKRFSMDIFEKIDNRKDFLSVMQLVAIENLRPFFDEPHTILDVIVSQNLAA